jgi:hypothetical protein
MLTGRSKKGGGKKNNEKLCTGGAKRGKREEMLSTESVDWSKQAPFISERSSEFKLHVCTKSSWQKGEKKKMSAFLIP